MNILVFIIGLVAQGFFAARILVQLFKTEKHKKVENPTIFWIFSILCSLLFFLYGWCRGDFSIILGQCISFYIYWWNLKSKHIFDSKKSKIFKYGLLTVPIFIILMMTNDIEIFVNRIFRNSDVPLPLLVFGSIGQVTFTLRFVYQWYYSIKIGESSLPKGFWVISLVGSSIILIYGVIRLDPILILGQSFGFISYIRNLVIGEKEKLSH